MIKGLSNEFKVGVLTVISVCVLILGYNYMMGRDNLFQRGRTFQVYYGNTQGLSVGSKVIYNGFKVGALRSLKMVDDQRILGGVEITSNMPIPKDSRIKIESQLLGGVTLKLILGTSHELALDGDTLSPEYSKDIINVMNNRVLSVANSADSFLGTLNAFFHERALNQAISELPGVLQELTTTLAQIRLAVAEISPALLSTTNSLSSFSNNLPEYDKQLREGLGHLNNAGRQIDSVKLDELLVNLSVASKKLADMMTRLEAGKGSVGKLLNDEALYIDIVKTNKELQRIMLDLKKYPEKYIPVPGTKKQRNSAKRKSLADTVVWNK